MGKRLYSKSDLTPLACTRGVELQALTEEDREYLLMKLPPQAKLHALRSCQDRDTSAQDFMPWTQVCVCVAPGMHKPAGGRAPGCAGGVWGSERGACGSVI